MSGRPGRVTDWLSLMKVVVITDSPGKRGRSHLGIAQAVLQGGCRAVQLRDKDFTDRAFIEIARRVKAACDGHGALFFVNDRVDVAAVVGASGVHLGVDDLSVEEARGILGDEAIIGYSPEGAGDAVRAVEAGVDYLGVGPVAQTASKSDAGGPIGLAGLSVICERVVAPVIAVGGIDLSNAGSAIEAGADGVAAVSAVCSAEDMGVVTGEMLALVESALAERETTGGN